MPLCIGPPDRRARSTQPPTCSGGSTPRTSVPGRRFHRVGSVAPLLSATLDRVDALRERGALTRAEARRLVAEVRRDFPSARRVARCTAISVLRISCSCLTDVSSASTTNGSVSTSSTSTSPARGPDGRCPARMRARFERRYANWGRPVPVPRQAAAWRVCADGQERDDDPQHSGHRPRAGACAPRSPLRRLSGPHRVSWRC